MPRPSCPARSLRAQLRVEELEGRVVASATPTLDLSTAGSLGAINGAVFRQVATQPAGCGVMQPFVRLQASGVCQGYNTDARPLQFDEKTSSVFTHAEPLSAVPEVNIGGVAYREFLLNLNQTNSTPYLSLDALRIYTADTPDLHGYDSGKLGGISPGYDLGGNWIKLNSGLNPGNGKANMVALIPDSALGGGSYVYVYSKFGATLPAHGGFESWGVAGSGSLTATGSINGNVFNDVNANGTLNTGEPGLGNWMVTITSGVPGATPVSVQTKSDGSYSFNNLAFGLGSFSTYTVTVTQQIDWTATTPTSATIDLASIPSHSATVNFGEMFTGIIEV